VDVLRGADTERIRSLGHDRLSTYGIGREFSDAEWTSIIRQLIHRGYLLQDIADYSVLKLTAAARPLLRGEARLELARPRVREKPAAKAPKSPLSLAAGELPLFEALRALRRRLAEELGVPPYVVFGDVTLVEMSHLRPQRPDELLGITGIGQVKLERYGEAFLAVIRDHPAS
jgi:ATP-dependent DNA helicase RecQ